MPIVPKNLPVIDNDAEHQFEIHFEGMVSALDYIRRDDRVIYTHAVVPEHLESHGIAGQLTRHALEDARQRGLKVVPSCPYVAAYIGDHPEFADLVV
jgi:predicted GNAT family acetyltransferase